MEALLNAFKNWDQEKQSIIDICERVAGFAIKQDDIMIYVHDGSQIVFFESLTDNPKETLILRFSREDGLVVEQCLKRGEDGLMHRNPQKAQEAETRCEQLNAELGL